jgi:hydrogenase maturation factor
VTGRCDDGHCVTCADEALPMHVVEVRGDAIALCAGPDGVCEVMTDLVGEPAPGQVLLVHAGVALAHAPAGTAA